MLDSTFDDEAALKGYAVHPEHVAVHAPPVGGEAHLPDAGLAEGLGCDVPFVRALSDGG